MNVFAWLRRRVRDTIIGGVADALTELLSADSAPEEIEAVIEVRVHVGQPSENGTGRLAKVKRSQ